MSTSSIGRLAHPSPPLDPGVFPVTRRWAYCDHAAVGPLPQPTRDAVVAALDAQTGDGCAGILDIESRLEAVRCAVAAAIGATADDIAFMRSTSDGALVVANGFDWRDGDEVILSDNEFGANAFPWLNLHDVGVRPVLVRAPGQRLTVETLERMATDRTRVVTVSFVGFSDGYRHDLAALGAWCKAKGLIFAVDAIQGFGQLPLDVAACDIDVCYFGVAKWLLSPQGLSVVYVRRELAERLRPALCSWRSVKEPMRFLDYAQPLLPGARRFDGATVNYPAAIGFAESLRLITTAGLENIEAHVLRLGDRFIAGVRSLGLPLVSEVEPAVRSGIVVAGRGRSSVEELQRRARQSNVQVTIRDTGVRFAPHGYNTDADVDRVLSILA
ncbi:MAG: aminotransferase class V-fold PLP-dependent enzyme [Candidatus Eremiobacterales bacterium]|jgi:selenocysteine lyase/cysteine desulfurase